MDSRKEEIKSIVSIVTEEYKVEIIEIKEIEALEANNTQIVKIKSKDNRYKMTTHFQY